MDLGEASFRLSRSARQRKVHSVECARALDACRLTGGVLVVAKLDRLSRDAHFLLGLEKAGVEFMAADMPNANRLTVRLMAVIAQENGDDFRADQGGAGRRQG